MKDSDYVAQIFPGTTAGLQAAIDYLNGGKGHVRVRPGTIETDNVISIHSGCQLEGSGAGVTVIKRAAGSFTGTSPAYSANMFISTAVGANGTLNGSGAVQSEISISSLTIDGNQSAFSGVVFSAPGLITGHYGILFQYVDGIVLRDLEIKELLQTGTDLTTCVNARCVNLEYSNCGQYASPASRNSFNFNNGTAGAVAAGYAQKLVLTNFISKNPHDCSITLKDVNDVAISNCNFDGGLIGIEVEGTSAASTVIKNHMVTGIQAKNIIGNAIRLSPGAGVGYENMVYDGISCDFHPTLHGSDIATIQSGPLFLGRTNDAYLKGIKIRNGVFRNINSFSANTEMAMVTLGLPGTTPCSDIEMSNLSFYGANGAENNTTNKGFDIFGNITNSRFNDIYLSGAEGIGVHVRPGATTTVISDLRFRNVIVDGCQEDAFKCLVDQAGASITKIEYINCVARNPAINATSFRCFFVGCSTATGTCSDVAIRGNRGYRTSSVCNGIEIFQSGGSTVDSIAIVDNDFSDLGAGHSVAFRTGTPTNVWFSDIPFKGNAVASAATITLPRGNWFGISGTSAVDTITPHTIFDARPITFLFGGTASFNSGTGNMSLNGTFVGVNNSQITLRYDWVNASWYEVARRTYPSVGTAIASAATIAIPTVGDVFHVTGTTNITNGLTVNANDAGRTVVLIFDGILTMSDTGTSILSAALVTTANDTLTLKCDGTNWYEVARSVN
jgi:hypothetical protein